MGIAAAITLSVGAVICAMLADHHFRKRNDVQGAYFACMVVLAVVGLVVSVLP